jgi:nitrate/nitrite transport system substrate-binding protein
MVGEGVDYQGIVAQVQRPEVFREVARELGIAAPVEDVRQETFFDGVAFDPADPEGYARGFAVNALRA